ncbi:MAG: glycine cleavage system protein GcvH [Muribaculaceae bacterium]|nr:glycine cleavage system protein GcvH [Muribaculaceae bacterium]
MIRYSKTHEYIRVEGQKGYIGISDYAQKQLGNVVYVDMPDMGDELEKGEDFGAIESVKAASDLIAPVSGEVVEVNVALTENPRLVNVDPMANWIIAVDIADMGDLDDLMNQEEYDIYCLSESH